MRATTAVLVGLAASGMSACGSAPAVQLAHWNGNTPASFSLSQQTSVDVAGKAGMSGCTVVVDLHSDHGSHDPIPLTGAMTHTALTLGAGNWTFGIRPMDQTADTGTTAYLNCLYGGADVTVTSSG